MSSSANNVPGYDFQKAVRALVESVDRNQDYMHKQFAYMHKRFDAIDGRFDQLRKDINEDFKKALREER